LQVATHEEEGVRLLRLRARNHLRGLHLLRPLRARNKGHELLQIRYLRVPVRQGVAIELGADKEPVRESRRGGQGGDDVVQKAKGRLDEELGRQRRLSNERAQLLLHLQHEGVQVHRNNTIC